jgi:hypothetical protein
MDCGADNPSFATRKDPADPAAAQPHPEQALVYVIEQMPSAPFISTKVRVGIDGKWVGVTEPQTYMTFLLEPGVHHLCTHYQGQLALGEEGGTILHRLNLEAGKIYYILYRGLFIKDSGEVAFLDQVDADEGRMLLQMSDHVTSNPKK